MITKEKTYSVQNDEFVERATKMIRHSIITLNDIYRQFWKRDPQKIIESLNDDVTLALNRFHENTTTGTFLNQRAEILGIPERVTVVMPPNYSFDSQSMLFIYTPPVVLPEPDPTPLDPE